MDPSSFIIAADKGDLETIQKMLASGFDPNTRSDTGGVAIMAAALRGQYPVVETLLKRGANPNLRSGGSSALSYAVSQRNRDVFYLLLNHAERPNRQVLSYALEVALREGIADLVDALLKAGAPTNGMLNPTGVLINLVSGGHVKILKSLLAEGIDLDMRDREGETVLMRLACGSGGRRSEDSSTEAFEVLLANVADPFEADRDGFSVLTRATRFNCERIIRAFIRCGYPLDKPDANGLTALEVAIDAGQHEIVELLLKAGISPNTLGKDGQNSLLRAVTGTRNQSKEMIDILLRYGVDTTLRDSAGYTALERTRQSRQKNISQQLQQLEPNLFGTVVPVAKTDIAGTGQVAFESQKNVKADEKVVSVQVKSKAMSALEELQGMTGLAQVKGEVNQTVNFLKVQRLRRQKGFSVPEQNLHTVFAGNPGTGKTTVARLTARIYYDLGVLDKGQLVKIDCVRLVAAHLSGRIAQVVQSAVGGILYIDKAYSLIEHEHGQDQHGTDAVNSLLEMADSHRDNLIVIVGGYTEPMQKFIRSNPGLQSRFNKFLHFDDYAPAELTEIFRHFAVSGDYTLHPATELKLTNVFAAHYARRDETFGNARLARNLFEKAINAHANRMVSAGAVDEASLVTLYPEDIPNA